MFATVRNRPQRSAWGPYGRAYWKFCKRGHFWSFQRSFILRGRRGKLWHSNMFQDVSEVVLCGRRNLKMRCIFRGRRNTLDTSDVISRGTRRNLDVSCCVFFENRIVSAARSGDRCNFRGGCGIFVTFDEKQTEGTLYTLHSHFELHTLNFTLYTLHSTLHTPHLTLYTPRFTLHTPHFTLHTSHFTLYTPHFTLHTFHSTLYTSHLTLYTPHFSTSHFTLHTLHSTLHT